MLEAISSLVRAAHQTQSLNDFYQALTLVIEKTPGLQGLAIVLFREGDGSVFESFFSGNMTITQEEMLETARCLLREKSFLREGLTGSSFHIKDGFLGVFGSLILCYNIVQTSHEKDFELLCQTLSDLLAFVFQREMLQTGLRQSDDINEVLRDITRAIHTSENLDRLFETIHQILGRIIDVTNFYIGLYEKETNTICFPFFRDEMDTLEVWGVDYLKTDSLTSEVFRAGKPILLKKEDLEARAREKRLIGTQPQIWLGVPLMTRTEPTGVMVVQSYSNPHLYTQRDVDILYSVSEQVALAVERKRAETALKNSESKYRELFDSMPNGFYQSTPEGYIIDANPAFVRMVGYDSLDELKTIHIPSALYVDSAERNDMITRHQNTEFVDGLEIYRLKRKNGEIIWVEDNARYIKDKNSQVIYNQGLIKDITRRKMAEDSLHESEERFRTVIDHSYDAIFMHEPDGRIIDVNKTMLKMFQVTYEEALNYTIADYSGPQSDIPESREKWSRALKGEDLFFPWQAKRPKDGVLFDTEIYLTRVISGGRKVILGNVRDVTDQKQAEKAIRISEEKYRSLFENAVEGIYQTTPDGKIISVNPSFIRAFGFESLDELTRHFEDIETQQYVNPEDRKRLKNMMESDGMVKDFETRLYTKSGASIWVSMNSRAVKDEKGIILHYEGFLQDITERKKAEEALYMASIHDHLTGICNRRYIFERLGAMVEEHHRETRNFSLCIMDLDYFKKINDTHGHPAGDFILRSFAAILAENIRPYDLLGRYGGEEFIVVALNIEMIQTMELLERIQGIIRNRVFDFNGISIRFTFSAGVANSREEGADISVDNLIRKADERLYLAKHRGRDRIICQ